MPPLSGRCFYFGTFNPIHSGHLMIAQAALNQYGATLGFDGVTLMPAGNPPHRHQESDLLDAVLRLEMARRAIASNPRFTVSDFELTLPGKTYTVETLQKLADAGHIQLPVSFIIGADALTKLHTWHQPERLIEMVHFLQAPRPDYPWVESVVLNGVSLPLATSRIAMPPLAISSTQIRQTLRTSDSTDGLRYFLPEPVRQFIGWNKLYQA